VFSLILTLLLQCDYFHALGQDLARTSDTYISLSIACADLWMVRWKAVETPLTLQKVRTLLSALLTITG
jgi:hypothetical protein